MINEKYKIKIEEFPLVIQASAKTGNWLFGYSEVPFVIKAWRERQSEVYDQDFHINSKLEYDVEINVSDPHTRTCFYEDGKFQLSANRGRCWQLTRIEDRPIHEMCLQRYEPIIKALEERVGKVLIEREKGGRE